VKQAWALSHHTPPLELPHEEITFKSLVSPSLEVYSLCDEVYHGFTEIFVNKLKHPTLRGFKIGAEVFGKKITHGEALQVLLELLGLIGDMTLFHKVTKDLNLLLLRKEENVQELIKHSGWQTWFYPILTYIPQELTKRTELEDDVFKFVVNIFAITHCYVFKSEEGRETTFQELEEIYRMEEIEITNKKNKSSSLKKIETRSDNHFFIHPLRLSISSTIETLDEYSGWNKNSIHLIRAILSGLLNKVLFLIFIFVFVVENKILLGD